MVCSLRHRGSLVGGAATEESCFLKSSREQAEKEGARERDNTLPGHAHSACPF